MTERIQVDSANIDSVLYDPEKETLDITFSKGGDYRYAGVTQEIFDTFLEAPSKGSYLHRVIKPGCPCEKVEEESGLGELPAPPEG